MITTAKTGSSQKRPSGSEETFEFNRQFEEDLRRTVRRTRFTQPRPPTTHPCESCLLIFNGRLGPHIDLRHRNQMCVVWWIRVRMTIPMSTGADHYLLVLCFLKKRECICFLVAFSAVFNSESQSTHNWRGQDVMNLYLPPEHYCEMNAIDYGWIWTRLTKNRYPTNGCS